MSARLPPTEARAYRYGSSSEWRRRPHRGWWSTRLQPQPLPPAWLGPDRCWLGSALGLRGTTKTEAVLCSLKPSPSAGQRWSGDHAPPLSTKPHILGTLHHGARLACSQRLARATPNPTGVCGKGAQDLPPSVRVRAQVSWCLAGGEPAAQTFTQPPRSSERPIPGLCAPEASVGGTVWRRLVTEAVLPAQAAGVLPGQ